MRLAEVAPYSTGGFSSIELHDKCCVGHEVGAEETVVPAHKNVDTG